MRARNIKPALFKNPDLGECSPQARLGFIGLWCMADREGRLLDRAKLIKAELFPYDSIDVGPILSELAGCGLIKRYEVEGQKVIWIVNFTKHQSPHFKEKPSELPCFCESTKQAPTQVSASTNPDQCQHPLNPDSGLLNPDSGLLNPDLSVPSNGRPEYTESFERFWSAYPTARRTKKKDAFNRWKLATKSRDHEFLIQRATDYAASEQGMSEYAVMPSVWLNSHMWEDSPEAWKRKPTHSPNANAAQPEKPFWMKSQ
jgi:hypothetical protein